MALSESQAGQWSGQGRGMSAHKVREKRPLGCALCRWETEMRVHTENEQVTGAHEWPETEQEEIGEPVGCR